MPDNAFPSARNNPVVLTSLIALALAAGVLAGASLGGVAGRAVQDTRIDEILREQRRHVQSLERIELAVDRMRTEIALLSARIGDAAKASPGLRSDQPTPNNPTQSNLPQGGPEFDLGALRISFEAEAVALRPRASRPHQHRAGKGGPGVRI